MTLAQDYSENGTRISLIVSEIFDRKHIALRYFFLLLLLIIIIRLNYVQRILILQGLEFQEFILSDKECEYILPTFGHVSPPSRDGQSFIFRYQTKDINREERFFDSGWIIPTD